VAKYKEKLVDLQKTLEKNRPDMLLSLLKAIIAALCVFTFLAGFVFTVIPLARNIWNHVQLHIIAPVNLWIAEEPVFGGHMIFVFQAAATIMFIWLIRHYIMLLGVYIMSLFEERPASAKKAAAKKPVAKTAPTKTKANVRTPTQ